VDALGAQLAVAQRNLDAAEAQLAVAVQDLENYTIRAPFAGIVAEVSTEVGEWITPSPPGVPIPAVIDLLDPASIYVSAPIDEVDAERVKLGQAVRMSVDSRPDVPFFGRVRRVAPYVLDMLEQNRTVEIEVNFDEQGLVLGVLPGTSADVEVILDQRTDVLRVPSSAVADEGEVLVLADGILLAKNIDPGLRNWQYTEVLSGLAEGDVIVAARDSAEIEPGARAEAR